MKKVKSILCPWILMLAALTLSACSSDTSTVESSSSEQTAGNTMSSSSESVVTSSSNEAQSANNDLSQDAIYSVLQQAGYTGLSKFDTSYHGLSNAVQSQSMNYVIIGQVSDVAAAEEEYMFQKVYDITINVGDWVYVTNMKIGTLRSLDDLVNIQ